MSLINREKLCVNREKLGTPRVCKRWFPNGGSSLVRRSNSGTPFLPQFYLNFTSVLPQVYLFLTCFLPQFNLRSIGNLEPRFGNHGLQTFGHQKSTIFSPFVFHRLRLLEHVAVGLEGWGLGLTEKGPWNKCQGRATIWGSWRSLEAGAPAASGTSGTRKPGQSAHAESAHRVSPWEFGKSFGMLWRWVHLQGGVLGSE